MTFIRDMTVMLVLFALSIASILLLQSEQCESRAPPSVEYRWTASSGCLVKSGGVWIPWNIARGIR